MNDAARAVVEASGLRDFVALPTEDVPELVALRSAIEAGFREREHIGSGCAEMWPEIFEAGAALIKSQFPQFPDCEVFPGTGW